MFTDLWPNLRPMLEGCRRNRERWMEETGYREDSTQHHCGPSPCHPGDHNSSPCNPKCYTSNSPLPCLPAIPVSSLQFYSSSSCLYSVKFNPDITNPGITKSRQNVVKRINLKAICLHLYIFERQKNLASILQMFSHSIVQCKI